MLIADPAMRTFGLFILFALTPARVFAAAETIFVEDDIGGLTALLREELPEAVFSEDRARADLNVRLSPELRLSIVDRGGTVIVDRILSGSNTAAVRAATLLVVDATKGWQPPRRFTWVPRREVKRTDPSKLWKPGGAVGFGGAWRWSGIRPQPIYTFAVSLGREDFEASLVSTFSGANCSTVATETFQSNPKMIAFLGQGRWPFVRSGKHVEISLLVAFGYQHEWGTTQAIGDFVGLGELEHPRDSGPVARAALGVAVRPTDKWSLRLDAGVHVEAISKVGRPDDPKYGVVGGLELSRGPVSPLVMISLGLTPF
jgi:hypothetical protein